MRVRIKTAKGNEIHGKPPYPELFRGLEEEKHEGRSRWYMQLGTLEDLSSLVHKAKDRLNLLGSGVIIAPPSHGGSFQNDDGDCELVLTVWDDYLE